MTQAAKAVWGPKRHGHWVLVAAILLAFASNAAAAGERRGKLDRELSHRSGGNSGSSKVIITLKPGAQLPPELQRLVTRLHRKFSVLNAQVVTVPNRVLKTLAAHPDVAQIDFDRPIGKSNYRTSLTTGARAVQRGYGLTGAGIGVAVIDSGIASWHDDLTAGSANARTYPYGNQRVAAFVDFVNGQVQPYDDDGHGTHVAGIIAGNGFDSNGQKAGVAPDASLVSLKVLDSNGSGTISNIIAAFDWVVAHHAQYNIRVVNISVGAGIYDSYWNDPLTLAAKAVVDAGVVVVAAAGNQGKNAAGQIQYGGIVAPGNAPWVITVGASSTQGTDTRADDIVGSFSSRGPTFKDWGAKPDLVAPGTGTMSLASPGSNFYRNMPAYLAAGLFPTPFKPYLTLTGTSMAAPVVTGTVALMLQANPNLTPNLVKAILQYTAQSYAGYDALTEGAGFLNTLGAVRLARFFATAHDGDRVPTQSMWGKKIIWGNHRLSGGFIRPDANAWAAGTVWGATQTASLDNVVWGTACGGEGCDNVVWGTDAGNDNVVWGTSCGGDGCDNVVWGTDADGNDNVVWGTDCGGNDCDNVVWGTDAGSNDNVVWGTDASGDNVVWGTSDGDGNDNVVWGTSDGGNDNVVWGTSDGGNDNVVWGTSDGGNDNVVWGTMAADGTILWSSPVATSITLTNWSQLLESLTDEQVFAILATLGVPPPPPPLPLHVQTPTLPGGTF
jgi:serine protease AprX